MGKHHLPQYPGIGIDDENLPTVMIVFFILAVVGVIATLLWG